MSKIRLVGLAALAALVASAPVARAEDVSAKKIQIKDHLTKPEKRQVQVQSNDLGVAFAEAGDPGSEGASLHVYSATDDLCVTLPAGIEWKVKNGKWTYKSKVTKNSAQIKDGKLLVKVKSGVTYTLADDGTQGTVNAQVQFGSGTRYCLKCPGNKKDEATKFLGKDCVAAACDAEPTTCDPPGTTTTTSTTAAPTTTTTTTIPTPGVELQGALPATVGRFNYNLTLGLPGADAACNTNFPGTHACSYAELQTAAAAGDLDGLKDTGNNTVTIFWAIDSTAPPLQQCNDDVVTGLDWEYGTAHTASRGSKVPLDNALGTLGALQTNLQCNFSTAWVGCCL
jgi:hypothetical protein